MSNNKVKRWRSRPDAGKGGKYAVTNRPASEEVYHIKPNSPAKKQEPSPLAQRYEQEKAQKAAPANPKKQGAAKRRTAKPLAQRPAGYTEKEQRRAQTRRRRRRNNVALRATIASAVLVIGIVISIFVFFKIGSIEVIGENRYSAAQIIEASGIELGDNLFAPSSLVVQRKVSKQLPYIKSVSLKHQLPDKLIIRVEADTVKYAFASKTKTATKYILCDEQLKLLEVTDALPKDATLITGVGIKGADIGEIAAFKDEQKGEIVQSVGEALARNALDHISEINVESSVNISVCYNGRVHILLGQATGLDYKCEMAKAALEDALSENKKIKGTINVKQAEQTKQAFFKAD